MFSHEKRLKLQYKMKHLDTLINKGVKLSLNNALRKLGRHAP